MARNENNENDVEMDEGFSDDPVHFRVAPGMSLRVSKIRPDAREYIEPQYAAYLFTIAGFAVILVTNNTTRDYRLLSTKTERTEQ